MARNGYRRELYWLLALFVAAGLMLALWPRPAATSTAQEQAMGNTWNLAAALPPIDAAAPRQSATATFAAG